MRAGNRAGSALAQFGHSFTLKLFLLALVLLTVPVALYWHARTHEDEAMRFFRLLIVDCTVSPRRTRPA